MPPPRQSGLARGALLEGVARRGLDAAAERVAARELPGFIAGREPLLALRRRAVRPRLRIHLALVFLLDPVVAHRGSRVERVGDLAVGQWLKIAGRGGAVRPDARVAVGLEF